MKNKIGLLVTCVAVFTGLSGCASMQGSTLKLPSINPTNVETVGVIPVVEVPTWEDAHEDINDNRALGYGLVHMPAMEVYLNRLYDKIKETTGVPDWPGKVFISSESSLNAHASAAGNIFVNITVLRSFESEDEIFALLSHEFAHIYLGHQTAYRSRLLTDSAALLAVAIKSGGGKDLNLDKWGSHYNIGVLAMAANSVLIPAWQRSVEEQADMMGVTISLKNSYSYASGFKAFLERLAEIEGQQTQRKASDREKSRMAAVQMRKTEVDKAVGGMSDKANDAIASAFNSAVQNHDDAILREESLSKQVLPLLPRSRPKPRVAPWREALKEKHTAQVLAHYALFPRIEKALREGRYKEAQRMARTAGSGATSSDGKAVSVLVNVMQKTGVGSRAEQQKTLLLNQNWPQRSWAVQVQLAQLMAKTDVAAGKAFLEQQYQYFGSAPRAMPDLIAFYTSIGERNAANLLSLQCTVTNARFREVCMENTRTDAERQMDKAKAEARSKALVDGVAEKWKLK